MPEAAAAAAAGVVGRRRICHSAGHGKEKKGNGSIRLARKEKKEGSEPLFSLGGGISL